jgi:CIC family chloride channel protein
MVYLGSIVGGLTAKLNFYIPNLQSIAIACGVSAAISTAFNAPIAGLIFAHEVILRHYSLQAFAPTTVAAATGYIVANIVFERPALFLVDFDGVSHGYEFGLFALLGVACAFLATGFMQLILYSARLAQITKIAPIWRPAIAGLLVGIVALSLPDVLGTGKEALRFATIEGAFENRELALLVIAKITLTALCVGFGFAGGVFSPSLLIGILFGALFWSILEVMGIPNAGVAVYAICGMMAMTSPVIGAPLTTILIVFELTRNYDLTIAAMVAVVFANLLAYRVFGRSLFDVQLAQKGIDLSFGRDRAMLESVRVIDRSTNQFTSLSSEATVENAIDNLVKDGRTEATIIDDQGRYQGMLRLQDILQCSRKSSVSTLMRGEWPQFDENTSVWLAMLTLDNFIGEAIPIVASNDDKLLGMITEANLIEAYLETVHELRREENAAV